MLKHTLTTTALAALLLSPALAQDQKPAMPENQAVQEMQDKSGASQDMKTNESADTKDTQAQGNAQGKAEDTTAEDGAKNDASSAQASTSIFLTAQEESDWRASDLIGATVVGPNDESLGDINEVLLDAAGGIKGVVIGVGGFLGIGEKDVAVSFETLEITADEDGDEVGKVFANLSKEQLEGAPEFAWREPVREAVTAPGIGGTAPANRLPGQAAPQQQ